MDEHTPRMAKVGGAGFLTALAALQGHVGRRCPLALSG